MTILFAWKWATQEEEEVVVVMYCSYSNAIRRRGCNLVVQQSPLAFLRLLLVSVQSERWRE